MPLNKETKPMLLSKLFIIAFQFIYHCKHGRILRCPRGVIVKAVDFGIVVSEFVLQSRYYVHFQGKYPWERYKPPLSSQLWIK